MIFNVTHTTVYRYDHPVFLEPHTFRLKPRTDGMQQLLKFDIEVTPKPVGLTECRDLDGNMEHVAWFEGTTDQLKVTVSSKVVTLCDNPFLYILKPEAIRLPFSVQESHLQTIASYITQDLSAEVAAFSRTIAVEADHDTLAFLKLLNERIAETIQVVIRPMGSPYPPEKTLEKGSGACRDLTWLFMACCRSQGIAARFISGYQEGSAGQEHQLHAWAEVYLPGAGWRGYDPTLGLAVADRHVAIAAGPRADSAAPISGTFRGEGKSVLESCVELVVSP